MMRMIVRGLAVSFIILAGAGALNAQSLTGESATPNSSTPSQQDARIIALLAELADEADSSRDPAFASHAQMQAAALLWPRDREQARAIYRRAFRSLAPTDARDTAGPGTRLREDESRGRPYATLTVIERQQLRGEMLNQIAGRDPELAEELARSLADSITGPDCSRGSVSEDCEGRAFPPPVTAASQKDVEQRELLVSLALQIVERAPQRAMALAQLSLPAGISQNFSRLLLLLRAADAGLADLLFASALARLEQSQTVELTSVHALGSYLVSAVNSPAKEAINKKIVVRFLNLAFHQISRRAERAAEPYQPAVTAGARRDESAALYFIGRQLTDLFARYQPGRLGDVRRKLSQLNDPASVARAIDSSEPAERETVDDVSGARPSDDERERDRLSARAALDSVSKGEIAEAQTAAMKISDAVMRDRVIAQVIRLQVSKECFEAAVALARCISDDPQRVDALVMLAGVALASKDNPRAAALLNEAEGYISKARPTAARAQSLLKVVGAFSSFDPLRSFEVMQTAVKVMNDTAWNKGGLNKLPGSAAKVDAGGEHLYGPSLEATLERLGRADFDRALDLAQQIADEEAALIAQLAVCKGGLASKPATERLTGEGETQADANHL